MKLFFLLFISVTTFCYGHSGRTDANGGHYNHSTGVYHYHSKKVDDGSSGSGSKIIKRKPLGNEINPHLASIYTGIRESEYKVLDGDRIQLKTQLGKILIMKLQGIDAPEIEQPYGKDARDKLVSTLKGKKFWLVGSGLNKKREVIVRALYTKKGGELVYINDELVKAGYAWWDAQQPTKDKYLKNYQAEAQKKKLGLWEAEDPISPWAWRKAHIVGEKVTKKSSLTNQ